MLEDTGAHEEEGELVRECKVVHESILLSSWLRSGGESSAKEGEEMRR